MKILLVEDNLRLSGLTLEGLQLLGLTGEAVATVEAAATYLQSETYDVLVLDRMLPNNQDGLDFCRQLRAQGMQIPIILLTARAGVADRVAGLEGGADDYLVKPFKLEELAARIRTVARRGKPAQSMVKIGHLHIDMAAQKVFRDQQEIILSRRLWHLLEFLVLHQGRTCSKEVLIDRVWGTEREILPNTVESAVRQLRRKLGDTQVIKTVHSLGYRLGTDGNG